MDLQSSLELFDKQPSDWQIDLTPPEPWEWQPESSLSEAIGLMRDGLWSTFKQYGKQIEALAYAVGTELSPFQKTIISVIQGYADVQRTIDNVQQTIHKIEEQEDQKNGNFRVLSYKKTASLPVRVTNTGPPLNRFAKHGGK